MSEQCNCRFVRSLTSSVQARRWIPRLCRTGIACCNINLKSSYRIFSLLLSLSKTPICDPPLLLVHLVEILIWLFFLDNSSVAFISLSSPALRKIGLDISNGSDKFIRDDNDSSVVLKFYVGPCRKDLSGRL